MTELLSAPLPTTSQNLSNYLRSYETNLGWREKGLSERAAIEAIHDSIHLAAFERAVSIPEDDRALQRILVVDADLIPALNDVDSWCGVFDRTEVPGCADQVA